MAKLTPTCRSLNPMLWLCSEGHRFGQFSVMCGQEKALPIFQPRFSLHGHFSGPQGTSVGLLVDVGCQRVGLKFIS